jgi:hypothetical protein
MGVNTGIGSSGHMLATQPIMSRKSCMPSLGEESPWVWRSGPSISFRSGSTENVACWSSAHFWDVRFKGASLEGGEDPQWLEVVAPRGDFAVLDGDN